MGAIYRLCPGTRIGGVTEKRKLVHIDLDKACDFVGGTNDLAWWVWSKMFLNQLSILRYWYAWLEEVLRDSWVIYTKDGISKLY